MILYGSAWNPGLSLLFGSSLNVIETIFCALVMVTLMGLMVILLSKFKLGIKQLVT